MEARDLALLGASALFSGADVRDLGSFMDGPGIRVQSFRAGSVVLLAGCVYRDLRVILEGEAEAEMAGSGGRSTIVERFSASEAVAAVPGARPPGVLLSLMDQLFLRALRPPHASTSDQFTPIARFLLYVRGHWLRMPPWLLTQHLTRKLLTQTKPPKPAQTPTATGAA